MQPPIELIGVVGRSAFDNGLAYARQGRVRLRAHDTQAQVAAGEVEGSGGHTYATTVYYSTTRNGTIATLDAHCSCPVRVDCKHGVALLVTALEAAASPEARAPSWQRALADIFGAVDDDAAHGPLPAAALALEFTPPASEPGSDGGAHWIRERYAGLTARAMQRGKRGQWITTGVGWTDLERGVAHGIEPAQADALRVLARVHRASQLYGSSSEPWIGLHHVSSPALWPALRAVADSGVVLLETDGQPAVLADEPARAEITVRADDAGLQVHAGVVHDLDLTGELVLGSPAHGVVGRDAAGVLHLVPFERHSSREWVELRRRGAVAVPREEAAAFEREVLPRIARQRWSSPDSSYTPAPPPPPTLRVVAHALTPTAAGSPRLAVHLDWRYGSADDPLAREHVLAPDPRETRRDASAERAVLATVVPVLERLPALLGPAPHSQQLDPRRREVFPQAETLLSGRSVVAFLGDLAPTLAALAHVEVTLPGDGVAYRDLGEPEIAVTVASTGRDWFDLEVEVRVQGHAVPIGQVIRALALGERTLFLPDGGYVPLDRPELEQVRALIDEGRALADKRRESLRVSRLNVSWWEDLIGLGIIEDQIRTWVERLREATSTDGPAPAVPPGLRAELRPYQREGYEWLARLQRAGLGGVLADDMGLGKTLQTLAMILDAVTNPTDREVPAGPFLVVAPTSVVPNWASEAARFTPDLRVVVIGETERKRGTTLREVVGDADVVVTSYALFRLDYDAYEALAPRGLVLDEAQNAKNHTSKAFSLAKRLPVDVTFAITGTPLENRLSELWAMFALTAPGLLGSPQQFHEAFAGPIERGNGSDLLPLLRRRIAPFLLRRTKEEVATDLPAKQEQVLEVELSPAHRRIYARHLARERQRVLGLVDDDLEANRVEVLSALTRLRQLAIDAALVDPEYGDGASSKLDVLLPLLTEAAAEGHRVLVFSQFTRYLRTIAARLEAEGLAYSYLDGTTTRRADAIRGFAEGEQPVFLISLKAGGVGLNLAMADYCVLADPWWNPAAEAQAVDRAHRIGQTRPVVVYRLVAKDTIEEKVMALQDAKRTLVAGVLGSADVGDGAATSAPASRAPRKLSADDVRQLLS